MSAGKSPRLNKSPQLNKSHERILNYLKSRGPQSVRLLAKELGITTMGVRQHLTELAEQGLVTAMAEARQRRGRPVRLWKLTQAGHERFPDSHSLITLELIDVVRTRLGEDTLNELIDARGEQIERDYAAALADSGDDLPARVQALARLRSNEGYMAEVRLLPDGWLLIENHCPICAAAMHCQQFCRTELSLFKRLLSGLATVERSDHLLAGARRCAYKITPQPAP